MANHPNLRFQPSVDITGIARLIAQRPAQEEQIRSQQAQRRQQSFQNILSAAKLGAQFAEQASIAAQRRQSAARQAEFDATVERIAQAQIGPPTELREAGQLFTPEAQAAAQRADIVRAAPKEFIKTELARQAPAPAGTPPRSIESFFVGKASRGEITIDAAVQQIQKAEPNVTKVTDNEGNVFLFNKVTDKITRLTGITPAPEAGKTQRTDFTPVENKAIAKTIERFDKNPAVIENKKAFNIISSLRELVVKRPRGAIGITLTQQAKFAGEMGRLTDQDITRNAPTPDIAQAIIALRDKWVTGRISEVASDRLQIILNIVESKRAEELEGILSENLDALELEVTGANRNALRTRIGAGILNKIDKIKAKGQAQRNEASFDSIFEGVK